MRQIGKHSVLFLIGGLLYWIVEMMFRGHSHWSMVVLGGICFVAVGLINELFDWDMPLLLQGAIGSAVITCLEFGAGCLVNLLLGWNVWNYGSQPFNICGQVCLGFSILWIGLAIVAVVVDDYIRHWCFGEEKPRYHWF